MVKRYDKISTYYRENLFVVFLMSITALLFNGLMCLIPLVEGKTINSLASGDTSNVIRWVLIFIGLVSFVQLNRFFKRYLVRVFGNKMALKMRQVSFNNLIYRDISFFASHSAGDILNSNLSDIYDTTEGIRKMTTECFDTFVLLIGYLITMFFMDWQISFFTIFFIVISIVISHFMKRFVYKANKDYKNYLSQNKELTITNLNNELFYRGFGVNNVYLEKYLRSNDKLRKKNTKALMLQSSLEPLYSAIALLGVLPIILIGGYKVINGVYEIGILSAYLTTYLLVAKKASKTGKLFNAYQGFKVSWERCRNYLSDDFKTKYLMTPQEVELQLHNFSFAYENFYLGAIDLQAKSGDIIGICGKVHSGKSTILKALTGIYDYQGTAKLGGCEIKELCMASQQYISYCGSNVCLFSDSIKNNIELGRSGDLSKALCLSKLDEDLEELGGIAANLSHSNANISGGQKQRLQMARAVYPNTMLLLLDDPFQSVSLDMAVQMIEALKKANSKQIIVLTSNNPHILQECTQIIFLNSSMIVGDYSKLLENSEFKQMMEAD